MSKLFSRIKKLAEKNGEVVIINEKGDDAFVVMSLDRYEVLTDNIDFCPEGSMAGNDLDCEPSLEDIDFSPESFVSEENNNKSKQEAIDDKELMKKVNEDIAKWREEQEQKGSGDSNKELEKKTNDKPSVAIDLEEKEENVLTEEEKYYLEPLE
tara:strand:+ start:327 stop:788 length:462 start_codon:yes stop_codon:yes gene_type:complete